MSVAKPYSWTIKLFERLLPKFGINTTFVDGTDTSNFEKAITPNTKLIYLESPNTFTYELQDIPAVVALAKKKGIVTMIDNSYSSPLNQQPYKMVSISWLSRLRSLLAATAMLWQALLPAHRQ